MEDPVTPQEVHIRRERETRRRSMASFIWEVVRFIALALLIVIPIRVYIAQPYIVSGSSMDPTFESGNYIIVDQLSYRFEEPARGDVIIFRFPENPSKFFIKRIIGLPGETVRMDEGRLAVLTTENEKQRPLEEPYLSQKPQDTFSVALSEEEYFVMGDNRSASLDSRVWGPLGKDFIIGKAFLRLLPVTEAAIFPGKYSYEGDILNGSAAEEELGLVPINI